jgi:hypothetical protein
MTGGGTATCRVRLSASGPVAGSLAGRLIGFPFVSADLGADRISEDWSNPVSLVVAPPGIDLDLSATASATYPFVPAQSGSVAVTFATNTVKLTTTGQPCEASLSAWSSTWQTSGDVTLSQRGWTSAAGAVGFFIFGVTPLNLPIPPLQCILATDIIIPVLAPIDVQVYAQLNLRLGAPVPIGTFLIQFITGRIEASGEVWRTSNRVAFQPQ